MPNAVRLLAAAVLLIGSIFMASQFGLVALISRGYRALACLILALYVVPLMSYGLYRVMSGRPHQPFAIKEPPAKALES
jgi:uncharacterized membrane protein YkvI